MAVLDCYGEECNLASIAVEGYLLAAIHSYVLVLCSRRGTGMEWGDLQVYLRSFFTKQGNLGYDVVEADVKPAADIDLTVNAENKIDRKDST